MTTATRSELRRAFSDGAHAHGASKSWAEDAAKRAYPIPTVTRAREIKVDGMWYRVSGGQIEVRGGSTDKWNLSVIYELQDKKLVIVIPSWTTAQDVAKVFDLIRTPTETVEVEA